MSKPILVGYDPQTRDRAPVLFGVAAARFTGAPLIVASVCAGSPIIDSLPAGYGSEELLAHATEALEPLGRELDAEGVRVEYRELENTSAPRGLHEAAEREGAGLLVVGSTGRGAVGRVLPGSTAERLMHGAPCAVAVVPHGWEAGGGLHTIGVAYADTDEAREALRGAHALARRAGATLRVLTVVKVHVGMYGETEAATAGQRGKEFEEVEGEHRVRAEAALRSAVAELDGGVEMTVDAFVEDPADTLVRVSENLDLLVCGSRGYGPLRAVLLGGVSRRVVAEAHCPVIVLPRGVEGPLEALTAEGSGTSAPS
jgi:nucleotide-binding universal stress UspA family protein